MDNNGNFPKLPVGFRFLPTDEELLLHYLKPKILSLPLPIQIIPHHQNLFHSHPSHLYQGESKEKMYFFWKRSWNYFKHSRISTCDGSGYWKASGKEKNIYVRSIAIGKKKSFMFCTPNALKTQWVMKEFSLEPSLYTTNPNQEMEDWVVLCIYERKRGGKNNGKNKKRRRIEEKVNTNNMVVVDFMIFDNTNSAAAPPPPPPPLPSYSSDNISCATVDDEEACSGTTFNK